MPTTQPGSENGSREKRFRLNSAYWKQQLGGELPVLELPTDRPRPAVQTFNGAREWLVLPEQLTDVDPGAKST